MQGNKTYLCLRCPKVNHLKYTRSVTIKCGPILILDLNKSFFSGVMSLDLPPKI
jgi:hypothetical protein